MNKKFLLVLLPLLVVSASCDGFKAIDPSALPTEFGETLIRGITVSALSDESGREEMSLSSITAYTNAIHSTAEEEGQSAVSWVYKENGNLCTYEKVNDLVEYEEEPDPSGVGFDQLFGFALLLVNLSYVSAIAEYEGLVNQLKGGEEVYDNVSVQAKKNTYRFTVSGSNIDDDDVTFEYKATLDFEFNDENHLLGNSLVAKAIYPNRTINQSYGVEFNHGTPAAYTGTFPAH